MSPAGRGEEATNEHLNTYSARRTIAELTCPVAVVAHHVTPAERARRRRTLSSTPDVVCTIR
jgi:hypothetical protein